ncbi:hypothetical protein BCY90_16545 [Agrobacterium deltaense]|uniref:hypothetical protein n=1 Tax=Agrobacterium TaxID=357 RepID=UPI000745A385|nr:MULTISPECIES: hypothetical protein [Agrobacterium]KVK54143.1 hypothetical protein L901_17400 [Agrobacterium sp. D14]RKF41902.1 hypothetical protein BCY90_16545 [Agrobacterium deltaense]
MSDRQLKQKLADLSQRQIDDEKKVKEIEENLARASKAQATAVTLSMMASSPGELQTMVKRISRSHQTLRRADCGLNTRVSRTAEPAYETKRSRF